MTGPLHIRKATHADAPAISALILSLAHHFLLNADGSGAEAFVLALQPEGIERHIASPEIDYHVGMLGDVLAGVVAVRRRTHLFHLFVDASFQKRGHAMTLWMHAKATCGWPSEAMPTTVNSTPFAMPFYERLGFRATGPRVETNGIAFVPMRLATI
jgi:GNAT superfamily N-acetyltransferase